jgi:hypothetical protein
MIQRGDPAHANASSDVQQEISVVAVLIPEAPQPLPLQVEVSQSVAKIA